MSGFAMSSEQRRRESLLIAISLALTLVAAVCVGVGLYGASLDLSDYGLVSSFPPTFFVGLALLTLASSCLWFTQRRVTGIVLVQLAILLVALWLSPYLIESTARVRASYKNFGAVDSLLRGGGFAPDEVVYHNWPLFPAIMAGFTKVTGIGPTQLMGLFPFVMQAAYLLPLTALLRAFPRSDNRWWAGVWFFYLFDWTGQDYFSPQAFSFLLFLTLIAVLAHVAFRRKGEFSGPLMALTLALYIAIVLTHFLTAVVVLAVVAALTVGGLLRRRTLVLTAAMVFVAWQTYGAFSFFSLLHGRLLDNVLDPVDFFNSNFGNRVEGSPDHAVVGRLRVLMTVLAFAVVGVSPFIDALRRAGRSVVVRFGRESGLGSPEPAKSERAFFSGLSIRFALLSLLALLIVAPIYSYGGEILIRVLLFSLPALALLTARATSSKLALLLTAIVLVPVAPLHVVTHYGNEAYDYVSPGEIEGFDFIANELPPANIYGGYPGGAFRNVRQLDWRHAIVAGKDKIPSVDDYLHPDQYYWEHGDRPIYVAVSRGDGAGARIFYNERDFSEKVKAEIARAGNFRLVFDNGDYAVYQWCGDCDQTGDICSCDTFAHAEYKVTEGEH